MSRRILVIDDEAHILQVLTLKLRNAGYEVVTATDGEEGLELATRSGGGMPDLIITDFQMPYMTGLELCRALAAKAETACVPVIMLTARGYALDKEDLGPGGLSNIRVVLSKPFSPRAILQQVEELLSERGESKCGGGRAKPSSLEDAA
jgi:two-component system, OmpR family, alkaline phosphatase synthesis response regulator PhoP